MLLTLNVFGSLHVRFTKIFPPPTKTGWISHTTTAILYTFRNNSHSCSSENGTTIRSIQQPLISQVILFHCSSSTVNSSTDTTHGSSYLWTDELTQAPGLKGNKMRQPISYLQPTRKPNRSQWLCGLRRGSAGIVGSNPTGGMDVICECCALLGRGLRVGLTFPPD